jgi:hypothetical protein
VCPQCQKARQQWIAEHPKPRKYTEETIAGEWIGLETEWQAHIYRLILKSDRTGILTEAPYDTTNAAGIYRYEITRWYVATNDALECEFRQQTINEPLKLTGAITGQGATSMTTLLHNGEGGWTENILFWRAKDFDDKLKMLRQ